MLDLIESRHVFLIRTIIIVQRLTVQEKHE